MKHFNAHFSSTINIEYFVKQLFIFYYNQIIDKDAPLTISVRHIVGQMTEVKGVGRRRRTQLLDDLRNRRRYWELKEEV